MNHSDRHCVPDQRLNQKETRHFWRRQTTRNFAYHSDFAHSFQIEKEDHRRRRCYLKFGINEKK
jgi:hypothetical protein